MQTIPFLYGLIPIFLPDFHPVCDIDIPAGFHSVLVHGTSFVENTDSGKVAGFGRIQVRFMAGRV